MDGPRHTLTAAGLQKVLVLVGPRAVGKSTLGRALAERLKVPFVDGDSLLEADVGRPASDYLRDAGEARFRIIEARLTVAMLKRTTPSVFALGGGAILSAEVRTALRAPHVCVVLLTAPVKTLILRLSAPGADRPPLSNLPLADEVRTLLVARATYYQQVADLQLETSDENVDACCTRLLVRLREV